MRHILILLFFIIVSCDSHHKIYNDWFDLNLKANPRKISEITIFSLIDSIFPQINQTLRDYSLVHEYYFNEEGTLSKEFQNDSQTSNGNWIEYTGYINYQDSIIVNGHYTGSGSGSFREIRLLNRDRFVIRKTILSDTIFYQRNLKNKVQIKHEHFIGIDSPMDRITEFKYNDNGDIESETINQTNYSFNGEKSQPFETINRYKYIYDSNDNWIIRIEIVNSEISSITQREITY